MKTRQEIKILSKQQFSNTYWISVGATVLFLLIIGFTSVISQFTILPILLLVSLPITVGFNYFSLSIYRGETPTIKTMFSTGFSNYGRKLGGMLWMTLFTSLWTLLFIIPGIIKGIAYSMTPYILGDRPNVTAREALKISMRMTEGYKGDIFVMYLSFIGWLLLSSITLGLVGIFYSNPYMYISLAGLYEEIKNKAFIDTGSRNKIRTCLYEEIKDHALETGTVHATELA